MPDSKISDDPALTVLDDDLDEFPIVDKSAVANKKVTVGTLKNTFLAETDVAAKGDLYVATGNDAVGILTVGANGTVLTADSAASTGLKWDNPFPSSGDAIAHYGYHLASGQYLVPPGLISYATGNVSSNVTNSMLNTLGQPLVIGDSVTFQSISVAVTAANNGAGACITFGIYRLSTGVRIWEGATPAGSLNTTGTKTVTFASPVTLTAGVYGLFMGCKDLDTAGANPAFRGATCVHSISPSVSEDINNQISAALAFNTANGAMVSSLSTANRRAQPGWSPNLIMRVN